MGSLVQPLSSKLAFWIKAKTKHSVHSPFVFDLCTNVLENGQSTESFVDIQRLDKELNKNSRVLETTDFGAYEDNKSYVTRFLKVSEIASTSNTKAKVGELLYGLVKKFQPKHILELGTSLGVSTMYLAKAAPDTTIYTIEGCAAKVEVAKATFEKLGVSNILIKTGRFDTQLPQVLSQLQKLDFVYMDGHFFFRPTMQYLGFLKPYIHEDTILVINNIHCNAGMERAWKSIKSLPEVTVTIDVFDAGMVFFKKGLSKQDFRLRY